MKKEQMQSLRGWVKSRGSSALRMALGSEREVTWQPGRSSPGIGRRQEWIQGVEEEGNSRDRKSAEGPGEGLEDG